MQVVTASSELKAKFKHLPKGMVLDFELIPDRTQPDAEDIRTEIVRLWAGFDEFERQFEKIKSHSLGAWVTDRHIFYELFVPMFDKKPLIANAEELNFRLRDIARKMKLVVKDATPKTPMSVMWNDGREQHGCMFLVEFHEPNLKDYPF